MRAWRAWPPSTPPPTDPVSIRRRPCAGGLLSVHDFFHGQAPDHGATHESEHLRTGPAQDIGQPRGALAADILRAYSVGLSGLPGGGLRRTAPGLGHHLGAQPAARLGAVEARHTAR